MSQILTNQPWDEIEAAYRESGPVHHAVIDDFLAPTALESLRESLLNDSGWGYNPAQAESLYFARPNAPQIHAITTSLAKSIPNMLVDLELVEHWAFLHPRTGGLRPHFDVGAVTVNLWMTEDEYNLTPDRGGLVLYGVQRPDDPTSEQLTHPGWSDEYFAREHDGTEIRIPYQCNRAVLFLSALYHASDDGVFAADDLRSSRMNLTLLFDDQHRYDTRRERFGYG